MSSGGIPAQGIARGIERGRALGREQTEDIRRGEFLRAIDAAVEPLTDFECNFIESFLGDRALKDRSLDFQWFTQGRRKVVDGMIKRYGFRSLRHNAPPVVPQAAPGHCGFLKREDGQLNVLCNAPAVVKCNNGLELCAACDRIRQEGIEKLRQFKTRRLRN